MVPIATGSKAAGMPGPCRGRIAPQDGRGGRRDVVSAVAFPSGVGSCGGGRGCDDPRVALSRKVASGADIVADLPRAFPRVAIARADSGAPVSDGPMRLALEPEARGVRGLDGVAGFARKVRA